TSALTWFRLCLTQNETLCCLIAPEMSCSYWHEYLRGFENCCQAKAEWLYSLPIDSGTLQKECVCWYVAVNLLPYIRLIYFSFNTSFSKVFSHSSFSFNSVANFSIVSTASSN